MTLLTRDAILATNGRRFAEVDVPEWGGKVRLQSMSAIEAIEYHDAMERAGGRVPIGWVLARAIVDADGKPLFTEGDIPALEEKNPTAVLALFNESARLNKLSTEGERGS